MNDGPPLGEAQRLENLWSGEFGDAYVDRNADAYSNRGSFWRYMAERTQCRSALEVGCNVGGNLRWLEPLLPANGTVGVDVNRKALTVVHREYPNIDAIHGRARNLPFRDGFFDLVFSMGVLIHQPESTLPLVMSEMVRCARRWVLCAEYFGEETEEVEYRGVPGALFRRDYGQILGDLFPQLSLCESGQLGRDEGWDDVTWWLFEA